VSQGTGDWGTGGMSWLSLRNLIKSSGFFKTGKVCLRKVMVDKQCGVWKRRRHNRRSDFCCACKALVERIQRLTEQKIILPP
jgi:hypothetical protein